MDTARLACWSRRKMLVRMAAMAALGACGLGARPTWAESPPEISTIRLLLDPSSPALCWAPIYLAQDLLRLEGFTDVRQSHFEGATAEVLVLEEGRADVVAAFATDYLVAIDRGAPIVVVGGLHAGCSEMFASDRVKSISDLAGKRIAITGINGPEHILISTIVAFVGLDPSRDVEWIVESSYTKWPELLESGKVDIVLVFPPNSLELREKKIGHVILNTSTDEPWRNLFCCMLATQRQFVRDYPVAAKRVLRAFAKANDLCSNDKTGSAKQLVELGVTGRYDFAMTTLNEERYSAWRDFDPEATLRFYALRLYEAGMVKSTPNELLQRGTDFGLFNKLRRELKA